MTVVVERGYDDPSVVRLVRALYAEQVGRYGYADPVEADPADYVPPDGLFLVAYVDAAASACAGYRTFDRTSGTVEVRKMYTVPQHRGSGLGAKIVACLEQHAAERGAQGDFGNWGRNLRALG